MVKTEILKLKELPNECFERSWGAFWHGIRTFFGFKLGVVGLQGQNMSKNEILKLKELPNERLEGSWGALWLGIRTLFGFKMGVVGLQGEGKVKKVFVFKPFLEGQGSHGESRTGCN